MPAPGDEGRFAYVVFSHQRPTQVERLVRRILALSPGGHVVLHHDGRHEPMAWSRPPGPRVHEVEPEPMDWGGFTMVASTARVLARLADIVPGYEWCALISGQDYPVTDLSRWEQHTAAGDADYVLAVEEVPFSPGPRRALVEREYYVRYAYRWRPMPPLPPGTISLVNGAARLVGAGPVLLARPFKGRRRLGVSRRPIFDDTWRCYKGSQWMALRRVAVERILAVMAGRPELARYYAETLVPDESFFQSLLANQTDLRRQDTRLTFTRWAGGGAAHPTVLGVGDAAAAVASGCPFARKFDTAVDADALDAVDAAVVTTS